MKRILLHIAIFCCIGQLIGQSDDTFQQDIKQADVHFLETTPITIVIRGNYSYSFLLINNEKGMQGCLISKDGVKPEKGDELIFVNGHDDRKSFEFYDQYEADKKSGRPIYSNFFFINNEDIQWLLTYKISNFYIKKTALLQMRKFALSKSRADKLARVLKAFNDRLDRTLVYQPVVVQADPHAEPAGAKWIVAKKSRAVGRQVNAVSPEVKSMIATNKQEALAVIQAEQERVELIKNQLREEVTQARLNAELQKEKFAKEVRRARELSLKEIEKINSETTQHIAEKKLLSEEKAEKLAWEVYNAKIKSAEAVAKIKNRSEEKILDHENELEGRINELNQEYKAAQDHYSANVQNTKKTAIDEINAIRQQSGYLLDSLRSTFELKNKELEASGMEVTKDHRETILNYQEMVLDSIAQMRERLARIKERNASDVSLTNNQYENKKIQLQKEYALELVSLKNRIEVERSKIKVDAVEEIERYNEALREAKKLREEEMAILKHELDSTRSSHQQLIIAERHKLETELQNIAKSVVTARQRSTEAIALASKNSTYQISEIQNLVEERRVELLRELDEDRKMMNAKRLEMNIAFTDYQNIEEQKKDSIQRLYVDKYQNLKDKYDASLFQTKVRNDSLIAALDGQFQELKRVYADTILLIRSKALQQIREIDQQSSTSGDVDMSLEAVSKSADKAVIQLSADHQEKLLKEKQILAKEILLLRKNHGEHLAEIQENIKDEVAAEFTRLKEVRSSLREEMSIMNSQFQSFKKQQQDRLQDESERFNDIIAATILNQLDELLRLDSAHQAIKASAIRSFEKENSEMKAKLLNQMTHIKDSLQNEFLRHETALVDLNRNYMLRKDSIRRHESDLLRDHQHKIKVSEENMLNTIAENENVTANEVYQARQRSRDEIARVKAVTLEEIKELQKRIENLKAEEEKIDTALKRKRKLLDLNNN